MISTRVVDGGEYRAGSYVLGLVVDVPNGVAMRDGACVECTVVTTRSPAVVFLGTSCSADDQVQSERRAVPSLSMASNSALAIASRSCTRRRCRQDTGGPGVILMWCIVLWRTSRGTSEGRVRSGNSAKRSSPVVQLPIVFTLGNRVDAVWDGVDREK